MQKAKAFLQNCLLEECTKANSGTCKKTGHKFAKVRQPADPASASYSASPGIMRPVDLH